MVVKLLAEWQAYAKGFESSVILYGSKTWLMMIASSTWFESSVILYGSKTKLIASAGSKEFESSVILYGSKTPSFIFL